MEFRTCNYCNGKGYVQSGKTCPDCDGNGGWYTGEEDIDDLSEN